MKKILAALALILVVGTVCFAQEKKSEIQSISANSFGYSVIGPDGKDNFFDISKLGGDGLYALITIRTDKVVIFDFIEIKDNMLIRVFRECGEMDYVTKIADDTIRFIVNGNRYIQHFYIGDDGKQYFSLTPQDIFNRIIFYFLDEAATKPAALGV